MNIRGFRIILFFELLSGLFSVNGFYKDFCGLHLVRKA